MHREEWGVINYGQRGPRGRAGRGVYSLTVDSEGMIIAEYTDRTKQEVGQIPAGEPGPAGENGRIVDVFVNSESVVDSEGKAYITIPESHEYEAGENIVIEDYVISSPMLIDMPITVTENVGGYVKGDTISEDTPIRDIIKTILSPEPRPVPPQENLFWWGVWGSRTSGPPTGITETMASESIEPAVVQRDGMVKYFTTRKQYEIIAYPADMPDLARVYENDLPFDVLNGFTKITCEYNGKQYKLYYNQLTQEENAKYQFMWR